MSETIALERNPGLRAAVRLEIVTIAWMTIEAAAAIGAGIVAHSLLLVAFGIDSVIELGSAVVVFRRLSAESIGKFENDLAGLGEIEHKTARIAGYLLFLLSAYVVMQATFGLITRHAAETSPVGIAIALIAAFGMPFLAKAKLHVAARIGSRALRADAIETLTCGYLSWILLAGLALNAALHWWWIDSLVSLTIVPLLVREGYEALFDRGRCAR